MVISSCKNSSGDLKLQEFKEQVEARLTSDMQTMRMERSILVTECVPKGEVGKCWNMFR